MNIVAGSVTSTEMGLTVPCSTASNKRSLWSLQQQRGSQPKLGREARKGMAGLARRALGRSTGLLAGGGFRGCFAGGGLEQSAGHVVPLQASQTSVRTHEQPLSFYQEQVVILLDESRLTKRTWMLS